MIVAVVPLKDPKQGKSRLGGVLSAAERAALVLHLAEQTVNVVRTSGVAGRIALAVCDRGLADAFGVEWVPDAGSLNATLRAAARWAGAADGMLVVAADLPLLTTGDLLDFVAEAHTTGRYLVNSRLIAIGLRNGDLQSPASSRRSADGRSTTESAVLMPGVTVAVTPDAGTGALLLRPPKVIEPRFGINSAELHAAEARQAGVPVRLIHRGGLTRDLDTPADLAELGSYLRDIDPG